MNNIKNKNVIVTGATGGIGNSIIQKLNDNGANILASGTRIEKLEDLKSKEEIKWPKANKNLIEDDKIDYVIQINGKKRAILNESRDIGQDSLMDKVKLNKLSNKYLKGKSINKIIFVKNRLINLLINE